jgi:hypothetical protein
MSRLMPFFNSLIQSYEYKTIICNLCVIYICELYAHMSRLLRAFNTLTKSVIDHSELVVLRRDRQVANTSTPSGECRGGWACKSVDGLHDKFDDVLMRTKNPDA